VERFGKVLPWVAGAAALLVPGVAHAQSNSDAADAIAGLFGGGIACCCWGGALLFGLAVFVFWVWMLIDAIQRDPTRFPGDDHNTKVIWIVALLAAWVLSAGWIVAIVYYFLVYRAMPKQ
jgi:hypothetical protein